MIAKALFFFVYIQFFDIINQFLFQTVLVIIYAQRLFECVRDAFFHLFYPFFLIRSDLFEQQRDIRNLFAELLFQCGTFLFAEIYQMINRFKHRGVHYFPFLFR